MSAYPPQETVTHLLTAPMSSRAGAGDIMTCRGTPPVLMDLILGVKSSQAGISPTAV